MVQEEETKLRGSRPRHETPLNSDSRCAWEMEGERHGHPWTHEKIAFDMAMMGIKPQMVPRPSRSSSCTTMVQGMGRYSGSSEEKQVCMPRL